MLYPAPVFTYLTSHTRSVITPRNAKHLSKNIIIIPRRLGVYISLFCHSSLLRRIRTVADSDSADETRSYNIKITQNEKSVISAYKLLHGRILDLIFHSFKKTKHYAEHSRVQALAPLLAYKIDVL